MQESASRAKSRLEVAPTASVHLELRFDAVRPPSPSGEDEQRHARSPPGLPARGRFRRVFLPDRVVLPAVPQGEEDQPQDCCRGGN